MLKKQCLSHFVDLANYNLGIPDHPLNFNASQKCYLYCKLHIVGLSEKLRALAFQ